MNEEFRRFTTKTSTPAKSLTMPSGVDHKRMQARKIIEQMREDKLLKEMYEL